MLLKQKNLSLPRNLVLETFGEFLIDVLNRSKYAITPLFNDPEVLSSAFDKAELYTKNFSENSNLDDSGMSLPVSGLDKFIICVHWFS